MKFQFLDNTLVHCERMVDITSSFPQSEKSFVSYRVTLLIYSVTGFQMLVMLHLYFEVVLQPTDGQTSKDKLLSNSMINLFSDQCLFDFSCLFLFVLVEKLFPQSLPRQ